MRIAILGNAGCGKSTLSLQLSNQLSLPLHEVDQWLWYEGWVTAPLADYDAQHQAALGGGQWIIDGVGHLDTLDDRLGRATHIILCDFPLWQHYWLLSERQAAWQNGTLELRPGGLSNSPPSQRLFKAVWDMDRNWMPIIREKIDRLETEITVIRLRSFEALAAFKFQE